MNEQLIQGSPEWLQARVGKVTASRIKDILAKIKSGEAAARRDYRMQIVCEWLTCVSQDDTFENAAMRWGTLKEPEAREVYRAVTGYTVKETGLVDHPVIRYAAASPDGIIVNPDADMFGMGLVEIKCPKTATHVNWMLAGVVPPEHVPQMTWQLACCPWAKWVDFMSYDPRLPQKHQKFLVRLERDENAVAQIEAEVRGFLAECEDMMKKIEALG